MAVTNPATVRFCNEKVRVYADSLVTDYETARAFVAQWAAGGMAALIPNSAAENIVDGSATDGRFPINGQQVNALLTAANAQITWFETVVSGSTRIALIRQIAVGGGSRI